MSFEIPDLAIGAIATTLLAAVLSLLGLIISKEQKVSDLRQAWIDALRTELSQLIAHANAIHGASMSSGTKRDELWNSMRDDFVGINQATAAIRLRLNPEETPSKAILDQMEKIERHFQGPEPPDASKLNLLEKELVRRAIVVLKAEWVRVREGEPVFRAAKSAAVLLSAALAAAVLLLAAQTLASVAAGTRPPRGSPTAATIADPLPSPL